MNLFTAFKKKSLILLCLGTVLSVCAGDDVPEQAVDIAGIAVADPIVLKPGVPGVQPGRKMVFAHTVPWHN